MPVQMAFGMCLCDTPACAGDMIVVFPAREGNWFINYPARNEALAAVLTTAGAVETPIYDTNGERTLCLEDTGDYQPAHVAAVKARLQTEFDQAGMLLEVAGEPPWLQEA